MRSLLAKLFKIKPKIIVPYGGYTGKNQLFAQARVLEDNGIANVIGDGIRQNLWRSLKRFETDEIANAEVKVAVLNREEVLRSDKEGYVHVHKNIPTVKPEVMQWLSMNYTLKKENEADFSIADLIMQPGSNARFGIISDIDETILHTGLTSFLKWRVLANTFGMDSSKRKSLEGAETLYNKLAHGKSGKAENPFFYLSNSPWNLFDYLTNFLKINNFPKGVLLLRDIGIRNKRAKSIVETNKYISIKHILESFPELRFILIGDAVDKDPEIYTTISKEFPEQIASIYIYKTHKRAKMKKLALLMSVQNAPKISLVSQSSEILADARAQNYI